MQMIISYLKERLRSLGKKLFGYTFSPAAKFFVYYCSMLIINSSLYRMKYKNKIREHNGVTYRSQLELTCALLLEENKIKFRYEPEEYMLVPGDKYPGIIYEKKVVKGIKTYGPIKGKIRSISYTPDFVGDNWIIETKGYETPEFKLKWKLLQHELLKQGKAPHLFKPTNKKELLETIQIIKSLNHGKIEFKNSVRRPEKVGNQGRKGKTPRKGGERPAILYGP